MTVMRSVVLGCGSYLPERILTNAELAATVDTSDEWIVQRTGIRQRHIAADGEFTSDLGIKAAQAALANAGIDAAVDRPDRAGDLDAGQHLSGHRGRRSRPRSASPTAPPSTCRRCARASSLRWRPPTICCARGALQARAGDRRGNLLAHPRLDRPHHLRAVRRRRRRRGAGGAGAARRRRPIAAS